MLNLKEFAECVNRASASGSDADFQSVLNNTVRHAEEAREPEDEPLDTDSLVARMHKGTMV